MSQLDRCPFCGGDKLKIDSKKSSNFKYEGNVRLNHYVVTVRCNKCHCKSPTVSIWLPKGQYNAKELMHEKAIATWNNRPPAHKYTLEELREMDGKAVWTKFLNFPNDGTWELIKFSKPPLDGKEVITLMCFEADGEYDCFADTYNKTWVAYDREPESEEEL